MTYISSMTDEQLNEALAIEVMKFRFWDGVYYSEDGREIELGDWQPTTDLNQAVGCAEKWINRRGHYRVRLEYQEDIYGWSYHAAIEHIYYADIVNIRNANPARALCEAVLMAKRREGNKFDAAMRRVLDENKGAWKALADGEEGKG